jgi:hypothetical protein
VAILLRTNYAQGELSTFPELLKRAGARRLFAQYSLTSTDAAHNMEDDAGETIADIGVTEGTWVVASAADEAAMRGAVIQVTYRDNDGNLKWTKATLNAGNSSTEVAFSPAISDGYMLVSMTALTTPAAQNVTMGPTGARTIGTILATAASATEANMHGIGSLFLQSDTDDNAYDAQTVTLEYLNGWGQVKWAVATFNSTDSRTEARFYESTEAAPGTAGSTSVKDFYRVRWAESSVAVQAGDDVEMGNSDTSAIYAAMSAGNTRVLTTRYRAPAKSVAAAASTTGVLQYNGPAYIARARAWKGGTTALVTVYCACTPYGATKAQTLSWAFSDNHEHVLVEVPIALAEKTDVTWTFEDDNAAHETVTLEVTYVEMPGH